MQIPNDGVRHAQIVDFQSQSADGPIRAALSTEDPVAMSFFGERFTETLEHSADAIDLSRASPAGLPLTINHSEKFDGHSDLPIGRVRNLALEGNKLRGDLIFDSDERAQAARGKVERGIAPDVSITYTRESFDGPDDDNHIQVTRWTPVAVSIVTVPADPGAGAGRSIARDDEVPTMTEPTQDEGRASNPDPIAEAKKRASVDFQAGERAATKRIAEITDAADQLRRSMPALNDQIDTLLSGARSSAMTVDAFRSALLDLVGSGGPKAAASDFVPQSPERSPHDMSTRQPMISMGATDGEKQIRGLELAILNRAVPDAVKPDDMVGNEFRNATMLDLSRFCLEAAGVRTFGMTNEQVAKSAISMRRDGLKFRWITGAGQYATSDFPAVTENIGFKAMFEGFNRAPRTWDMWCDTGSAPDFKQFTVPRLSHTQQLAVVNENAQYGNLTRSDAKEAGQLQKRGGLISYTWEATVNNDINGFTDQLQSSGEAAQATLDTDVYGTLIENPQAGPVQGPTMGDGNQLYSAAHSNITTDALSLAGIVSMRVAMGRQTDDNTNPQAVAPRLSYIVVPLELEDEARNLAGSEFLVDVGGAAQRANTVRNTFEVVPTHHLTDVTDYFGMARRGQSVRVYFLNGQQTPELEQAMSYDYDVLSYKVRFVYDVVWRDWRGTVWANVAG